MSTWISLNLGMKHCRWSILHQTFCFYLKVCFGIQLVIHMSKRKSSTRCPNSYWTRDWFQVDSLTFVKGSQVVGGRRSHQGEVKSEVLKCTRWRNIRIWHWSRTGPNRHPATRRGCRHRPILPRSLVEMGEWAPQTQSHGCGGLRSFMNVL